MRAFIYFIAIVLIILVGCSKPVEFEHQDEILGLPIITLDTVARDKDPLSEQAYNEVVSDEYEVYGRMILDHLRYRGATDGSSHIPSDISQSFMAAFEEARIENQSLSYTQTLNALVLDEAMNTQTRDILVAFKGLMNAQDNVNLSFGEAWYLIRDWESDLISNQNISEEDKVVPLILASVLRNMTKYAHETGEIVRSRSEGCFLGRTLKCWEEAIGKALLAALIGALKVLVGAAIGSEELVWSGIVKAAYIAGGVGLVGSVIQIYVDRDCRCTEESAPTCIGVKGISLIPTGCDQAALQQTVVAWGYSSPTGSLLNWVIDGGVFVANNNTTITTISPEVEIRQNSANSPIILIVWPDCTNEIRDRHVETGLDLPTLVNSTGEMVVIGPIDYYAGSNWDPVRYEFWGSWLASTNSVLTFAGCSSHGQVVNTGVRSVDIQLLSTQPLYPKPTVTGIIKNLCSNNVLNRNLEVNLH